MKQTLAVLVILLAVSTNTVTGREVGVYIYSSGKESCGDYLAARRTSQHGVQYLAWTLGYMSGYNMFGGVKEPPLGNSPSHDTIYAFLDKYCQDHPLDPIVRAAGFLIEGLGGRKMPKE